MATSYEARKREAAYHAHGHGMNRKGISPTPDRSGPGTGICTGAMPL